MTEVAVVLLKPLSFECVCFGIRFDSVWADESCRGFCRSSQAI